MAKKRNAGNTGNKLNRLNLPENVETSISNKIFENSALKQEQVDLLIGSFLSKKEDRVNIMYSNIVKNNISWDKLKERTVNLNMLNKYLQRDDLPLEIQNAIMRGLASKILLGLDEKKKKEFGDRFDTLLISKVQIDIKTLDEFKPFLKGINKDKLKISNDEIIDFLNDNKITNITPLAAIREWSLHDTSMLLELLDFEQKEYFDQKEKMENKGLEDIKNILNIEGLDTIKKEDTNDTYQKYVKNIESSTNLKSLNLDKQQIKDFVRQLIGSNETHSISSISSKSGKALDIKMKKSFEEEGGLSLDLDLNDTDPSILNWLENPKNLMTSESLNKRGLFYSVLGKNGEVRLADGYKIKIDNKYEGYLNYSLDAKDFPGGWFDKKEYPDAFDESGQMLESLAFLCDSDENILKDNKGKYIYTHTNNAKDKTIEIIDRKISLQGDKINAMMNIFYGWNSKKKGIEGLKTMLHIDKNKSEQEMNSILKEKLDSDGIDIGEPSFEEVEQNAKLNDKERIQKVGELFEKIEKDNNVINTKKINTNLFKDILSAHHSTVIKKREYNKLDSEKMKKKYKKIGDKYYEIGKDGKKIAGIYNYTSSQIKEKLKILQSSEGFETWQIRALLRYGICGINPESIQDTENGINTAHEWIENNEEHFGDGELDIEYALPEAQSYYNKLGKEGKKSFVETLKNTNSDINDLNEIKHDVVDKIENPTKDINHKDDTNVDNKAESVVENPKEEFDKAWIGMDGYKFQGEAHNGFVPGTRLLVDIGGSLLPPDDVEQSWVELEIIDTSREDVFSVKIIGGDIKTDMDGQIIKLPKTHEQLEKMQTNSIYKMPKGNRKSWDNCLSNINKTQIFDKITVFGSGQNQVELKGGEFVNGDGEKITHFCRTINTYDIKTKAPKSKDDEMGQTSIVTVYEVKPTKNGKVKVKCNFEGQDPNDFSKDVKFKHEKEMDYTSFMLLMESKQLYGKTKEDTGKLDPAQGDSKRHAMKGDGLKIFSAMSLINSVKSIGKNIKGKLEEYEKEQEEDFVHLLCSHEGLNLYGVMGSAFGAFGGLFSGMEDAMQTAGLEYYADRENRTWKKTEKRYNLFEKDPHFSTQWSEKLAPILLAEGEPKNRYQFAAAFLYLLKKDGPWSRVLFDKMGKGFWVEKFLGKKHAKRFVEMQAQRKAELEEYKKLNIVHRRQPRHTELARLEFDYLVGVIDGRQPFGGVGKDDEHFQASKWSRTFADKIQEGADEYFGGFEEKYKKIGRISFRQAEQEWFRHMRNMRPHKALPFLKTMVVNAQSKAEEYRAKSAILGAMLTGAFVNMQDHQLRSEFWKISRTMGFLPGLWVRDTDQQDNVVKMLDGITEHPPFTEKFSKATGYKVSDYQIDNFGGPINMPFLLSTFPRYWKSNGKKILEILQFQERDADNSIINLAKTGPNEGIFKFLLDKSRESTLEDTDPDVAGTYGFYEHSPLTANKGIISQIMPSNGKFDLKDNNMKEAAEQFWGEVGKNDEKMIPTKKTNRGTTEFIFGKYFNWLEDSVFSQGNLAFLIKGLALVKKLKEEGKNKEADYYLRYTVYGQVAQKFKGLPPEFAKAMNRFVKFFESNIDFIDETMVSNVCSNPEAAGYFKKPFEALPMKEFWEDYMSQTTGQKKSKYKRKYGEDPDKYINWQIDKIYRDLTNLNITPTSISKLIGNGSKEGGNETSRQLLNNLKNQDKGKKKK